MNEILLKADKVSKSYGATRAVIDFSIEIQKGEIRGLVGENGSGKSTFSSLVAGLLKPDCGELSLNGKPYAPTNTQEASQSGVGLVVQEIGTIGLITAASNIFINREKDFSRFGLIDHKKMNAAAAVVLGEIGGSHIPPDVVTQALNLEDRKLVEIAKAMYEEPRLFIVDETSNALSKGGRDILYQNIEAVKARGGSVLFITHDMNELVDICDSVTIMRDGRYVTTLYSDEMEIEKIKELMVGREIAENYYRPDHEPSYDEKEIVFEANSIFSPDLAGVSLQLHKGEILGIGGLTESGMHELGRILFGLDKTDRGTVRLSDGTSVSSPEIAIKNGVGYLSKNRDTEALILNFCIRDNICLPSLPKLYNHAFISPKSETHLAETWAEKLSVKSRGVNQFCTELSGGNKQKVVLAKWLGNDSNILIMDCPTRGIDIGVKEAIYKLMMELKSQGRSMIMISEEMPELIGMSDRILVMKNGKIEHEELRGPDVSEQSIIHYMI